jgi:hypothetical protein
VDKYQIDSLLGVEYGNNRILLYRYRTKKLAYRILLEIFLHISMNQKNKLQKPV